MTDRELLELAAKAAGYVIEDKTRSGAWVYPKESKPNWEGENPIFLWNPLTDDGDALRLAVKLGILSHPLLKYYFAVEILMPERDPYAATRRAIVRAAAEIGKAL